MKTVGAGPVGADCGEANPTHCGLMWGIWGSAAGGGGGGGGRHALDGKGPQKRLDRRLEEVAKAVGGGYCRLQMPLRLALDVGGTVAGHRLGSADIPG